jgi:hypothetical protein
MPHDDPNPREVWFRGYCGRVFVELRTSRTLLQSGDMMAIIKMLSMVRDWTVEDERAAMTEDHDPC